MSPQDSPPYKLNTVDTRRVAEALVEAMMPPLRQPGDVTVKDFRQAAMRTKEIYLNYRQAEYRLTREVEAERMQKLRVWDDIAKRECIVFRRIPQAPPDVPTPDL